MDTAENRAGLAVLLNRRRWGSRGKEKGCENRKRERCRIVGTDAIEQGARAPGGRARNPFDVPSSAILTGVDGVESKLVPTGVMPAFSEQFREHGLELPEGYSSDSSGEQHDA